MPSSSLPSPIITSPTSTQGATMTTSTTATSQPSISDSDSHHSTVTPSTTTTTMAEDLEDHQLAHRLSRGGYQSAGGLSINLSLLEQQLDMVHVSPVAVVDPKKARATAEEILNGRMPITTSNSTPAPRPSSTLIPFDKDLWQQSTNLTLDDPRASDQWSRPAQLSLEAKEAANRLWHGTDSDADDEKPAAHWLGLPENKETLVCYMDLFALKEMALEEAFRLLCSKLYFKAEAQQIDRILVAFAHRYFDCNPRSRFCSYDVVHTVIYSLLLLNTDLHVAQGCHHRMTRTEFVDNTMHTIRAQMKKHKDVDYPDKFEIVMESYLKALYSSIKQRQVLQPGQKEKASTSGVVGALKRQTSLKRGVGSLMRRHGNQTQSTLNLSMTTTTITEQQPTNASATTVASSVSTITSPLADPQQVQQHLASPSPSPSPRPFTRSRSLSLRQATTNKTVTRNYALQRSPSLTQRVPFYQHTSVSATGHFLMDVPYAKEAIVHCKHLLHSTNVRARSRHWTKHIMVVDQDGLRLYQFDALDDPNDSSSHSHFHGPLSNFDPSWNDRLMLTLPLNHTLANLLPPPGYSKARPHVFALQLADGGVYLFQATSQDDVLSWVATCNYWAARTSKLPLQGGVTNMEYGWGDCLDASQNNENDENDNGPYLYEWQPPATPMAASMDDEPHQFMLLKAYLHELNNAADAHRDIKAKMLARFPHGDIHKRAMSNWDLRSSYLLGEIIKYQHYCDALESTTPESSSNILGINIENQQLDMIKEMETVLTV
ncbi:hypothetical protein BC940DRAFT_308569 [Gongronella butleri]|nr:hypothetical protein BC940DRAFT_308569 [Gongronella butleri]